MIVIYELTESQLYNNHTIRYLLYYSLRRREPTTNERKKISTFFLKNGEITYKWYVSKEKKLIAFRLLSIGQIEYQEMLHM